MRGFHWLGKFPLIFLDPVLNDRANLGGGGASLDTLYIIFNMIFKSFGSDSVANRAEKTCIRSCGQLSPQWSLLKTSRSQFQQTPLSHFASEQRLNFLRWWSENFSNLFNIVPFNWQRKGLRPSTIKQTNQRKRRVVTDILKKKALVCRSSQIEMQDRLMGREGEEVHWRS